MHNSDRILKKKKKRKDNRVPRSPGFLKDFMTRHDVSSGGKSKNSSETRNERMRQRKKKKRRDGETWRWPEILTSGWQRAIRRRGERTWEWNSLILTSLILGAARSVARKRDIQIWSGGPFFPLPLPPSVVAPGSTEFTGQFLEPVFASPLGSPRLVFHFPSTASVFAESFPQNAIRVRKSCEIDRTRDKILDFT